MKSKFLLTLVLLLSISLVFSQTEEQKKRITNAYNISHLNNLSILHKDKAKANKLEALSLAKKNNWRVRYEEEGKLFELMRVSSLGTPIYYTTYNVNAAISTRANFLHNGGGLGLNLEGQNMTAHVWDGGLARSTHQEYDGAGGDNRFSIGDGTSTLHYHSAHVTGTIIAFGVQANAKGMAPQANAIGYEWNNDVSEATTAAGNGMLISNHSYGYIANQIPDQWFGAYGSDAQDWDDIMYNAPYYLMVVAAGNDGNDNSSNGSPLDGNSSYDKLSGHATAKNNMVVANGQDANVDASGNLVSVAINTGSSEGPTDDYRIKPDITGNGTSLYSSYESSDTAYGTISGTSMASPNVAGTLLILQQHYDNVNGSFMRAATLKGLALHTADDAGPSGPDAVYGWGLMNAKEAATTITNNGDETLIEENILYNGQSYVINVESDAINDLDVSISWTDPAGTVNSGTNSSTPALVNDLDVRVTQGENTSYPYKLTSVNTNTTGDNLVDPFERINIGNASGTYTISVTHKGSLSSGSQSYTLIVTGKQFSGVCNATIPTNLNTSLVGATEATLLWDNVQGATYEVRYRETGATTWITQSTTQENITLTGLSMQTEYEAQVRSICPDSSTSAFSSSLIFTTTLCSVCDSTYSNTSDDWISNVTLNTIDNDSGQGGADSYEDFTAFSTDVELDSTHPISVTLGMAGAWKSHVWAWVDWNHDCDFEDAGEAFDLGDQTNSGTVNGNIIVPIGATLGSTTMRVIEQYDSDPTPCNGHPTIYGETEDYTINVVGDDPPDATTIITASPNVMHGSTSYYITVKITELNNVDTNGLITVRIPKDTRWSLDGPYDPSLTILGTTTLNNNDWSYDGISDPINHVFTTTSVIIAGSFSYFGFNAVWEAGQTLGVYTITSQIDSGSGGEDQISNNVDAEKLDYFVD